MKQRKNESTPASASALAPAASAAGGVGGLLRQRRSALPLGAAAPRWSRTAFKRSRPGLVNSRLLWDQAPEGDTYIYIYMYIYIYSSRKHHQKDDNNVSLCSQDRSVKYEKRSCMPRIHAAKAPMITSMRASKNASKQGAVADWIARCSARQMRSQNHSQRK